MSSCTGFKDKLMGMAESKLGGGNSGNNQGGSNY